MPKTVAKKSKPKRPAKKASARPKDWRDAIRFHLAKVPEVDAVYVLMDGNNVHGYSVVDDFHKTNYKRFIKHETLIEKAFPEMSFEFHTRVHRGRKPQAL